MKKHLFTALLSVLSVCSALMAQNTGIYLPREYQRAIKNNTRSTTGAPGAGYFQNRADYKIEASFDPETRLLTGYETIKYTNNSPDTLKVIVMNIDHDIFKKGINRVYQIEETDLTSGVEMNNLRINGDEVTMTAPLWQQDGTEVFLRLKTPLAPTNSVQIELNWSLVHPLVSQIRTGTYDSLSFFIAYWFPRIAVYDDIFGWDYSQHLGSAEFYNDFGNFDVNMSLPGHYMMWSTGELQNKEEIFTGQTLSRLGKAAESSEPVAIVTADDLIQKSALKPSIRKNWHIKAENVTDFAFGISPVYLWDAVTVQPEGGKKVLVQAVYPEKATDFKEVAAIGAKTIQRMSDEITGFPYPYPVMTVFSGHGGMEFPMIVNDGPATERPFTVFVTAHEISHSWFPFIAGFNETRYGWMDEGLITFLPKAIEMDYFPESNPHRNYMRSYSQWAGREDDINMSVSSNSIANTVSYRQNVYARAAAAFYHLGDAMGKENFDQSLQTFLAEWAFKHPSPYDFMNTCSRIAREDLTWYFGPWFFENGYPDLAITNAEIKNRKLEITIERKGVIPVPIDLTFNFENKTKQDFHASSQSWRDGKNELVLSFPVPQKLISIELGGANTPDAFPKDNHWDFTE